ncbi:MAG: patatin-like phospholipase family protein [Phycisphaerales bacterium]|nr:MAG: patatin-like phospholipase family protein [Phycisphaerales bacterium]
MMTHLHDRWQHDGPKRLLALDGGGVRGVVTLAYLAEMENLLRADHGNKDLVLADYFDLIGGTSTGSIIAASLAMGKEVQWIIDLYKRLAQGIFQPKFLGKLLRGLLAPKFDSKRLGEETNKHFDVKLGSEEIRTGLMIMMRRVDTGSPWPVHNNPEGPFFDCPDGEDWIANREFTLAHLLPASCAAPSYFEPQELLVAYLRSGKEEIGVFVDGGVSPHNNPALQLLRLATLRGYGFRWPLGCDNLELYSIGTGLRTLRFDNSRPSGDFAVRCLLGLMDDCASEVEILLQWMSSSPTARHIDSEIGDLGQDSLAGRELFHYIRYNVELEGHWLQNKLGIALPPGELDKLKEMDKPGNMDCLFRVASKAARKQVRPDHFPSCSAKGTLAPEGLAGAHRLVREQ